MDAELVDFVTLAALILGLFAWPRRDDRALRDPPASEPVRKSEAA